MTGPKRLSASGELAFLAGGLLLGAFAVVVNGCRSNCGEDDCPRPLDVVSGQFEVKRESRSFEETSVPTLLPDLSAAKVEIAAEKKKVILRYADSLGELVQVTFEQRADGGGAGKGGG